MDDFDLYRWLKTLHVLSVLMLGSGIVVESLLGPLMARAANVQELRSLARVSKLAENVLILPGSIFVAVFGYATADRLGIPLDTTWLLIAQVLFWIAAAIGLGYLRNASLRLDKAMEEAPDGPIPPHVQAMMKNPGLPAFGGLTFLLFVTIVYLMVAQPAL